MSNSKDKDKSRCHYTVDEPNIDLAEAHIEQTSYLHADNHTIIHVPYNQYACGGCGKLYTNLKSIYEHCHGNGNRDCCPNFIQKYGPYVELETKEKDQKTFLVANMKKDMIGKIPEEAVFRKKNQEALEALQSLNKPLSVRPSNGEKGKSYKKKTNGENIGAVPMSSDDLKGWHDMMNGSDRSNNEIASQLFRNTVPECQQQQYLNWLQNKGYEMNSNEEDNIDNVVGGSDEEKNNTNTNELSGDVVDGGGQFGEGDVANFLVSEQEANNNYEVDLNDELNVNDDQNELNDNNVTNDYLLNQPRPKRIRELSARAKNSESIVFQRNR